MRRIADQFFVSRVRVRFIRISILSIIFTLAGCFPKAADDFTVLDNDVLSDLLRNSYSEVNLTPGHSYGAIGVGSIDKSKVEFFANKLFAEQEQNKIEEIFVKNRGECIPSMVQKAILCSFIRKWRLKNIGGSFDTSNWSDPAAKIEISFVFNEYGRMQNLNLKIIDVTEHKEIKG